MHLFTADKLPSRMGDTILFHPLPLLPYDTKEVPQLPVTRLEGWHLSERLFSVSPALFTPL